VLAPGCGSEREQVCHSWHLFGVLVPVRFLRSTIVPALCIPGIFLYSDEDNLPQSQKKGTTRVAASLLEFPAPAAFVGGTTPLSRGVRQRALRHNATPEMLGDWRVGMGKPSRLRK
jgi:hypothetical protein